MKDMASIFGQLGGLYTALFYTLKVVNDTATKGKFAAFSKDHKDLHSAENPVPEIA